MIRQGLVTIIMAAYNVEDYIASAINSVFHQDYKDWELIIVNDGSTDKTFEVINRFEDSRIRLITCSRNKGVSAARNEALAIMHGEYFCFLDADDMLTTSSLSSRIELFIQSPKLSFVDGEISMYNQSYDVKLQSFLPRFSGNPYYSLTSLSGDCFFGLTWMIRRKVDEKYEFNKQMSHAEDLLFFISISRSGNYGYVINEILKIRKRDSSAMSNLKGLENGYALLYKEIRKMKTHTFKQLLYLKMKIIKIMFLSYLKRKQPINAIVSIFRLTSS